MTTKVKKLLPTTPAFCFIAPNNWLLTTQGYSGSDRHLILAHLIHAEYELPVEERKYTNFYRDLSRRGHYIICDNSAFELGESFDPNELIKIALDVEADALVLPDYPGQPFLKTIQAAKEWIPKFKAVGLDTFFVPQGTVGSLEGWIESYKWAATNPDIDIIGWSILGIPNALKDRGVPSAYARVVMANILLSRPDTRHLIHSKYNHFLGLNAGPNLEVPALLKLGILDSIDSSGPVWSAINGHRYTDTTDTFMAVAKSELPHVDFDLPLPMTMDQDIQIMLDIGHNIGMTQSLFFQSLNQLEDLEDLDDTISTVRDQTEAYDNLQLELDFNASSDDEPFEDYADMTRVVREWVQLDPYQQLNAIAHKMFNDGPSTAWTQIVEQLNELTSKGK